MPIERSPQKLDNNIGTSSQSQTNLLLTTTVAPLPNFSLLNQLSERVPTLKRTSAIAFQDDAQPSSSEMLSVILEQLKSNKDDIKKEIVASKAETIEKLDQLRAEVDHKITRVESRVNTLENFVGEAHNSMSNFNNRLDDIEQSSLASHMDITGVSVGDIDANKSDLRAFAHRLIRSFNIELDLDDIHHAYSRVINNSRHVLVAVFSSVSVKGRVMKTKRQAKDNRKIFFDNRLTARKRMLFGMARKAVKDNRAKSAFNVSGKIFIEKHDGNKIRDQDDFSSLPMASAPLMTSVGHTPPVTSAPQMTSAPPMTLAPPMTVFPSMTQTPPTTIAPQHQIAGANNGQISQ